ncbi:hypothetical protein MASR2M78_20290 [Treponema sp.]
MVNGGYSTPSDLFRESANIFERGPSNSNSRNLFSAENTCYFIPMNTRMDKSHMVLNKAEELDKDDDLYWATASIKEKLQTMTYLRECFYGSEATTGRLQRFYQILKQK